VKIQQNKLFVIVS